TVVRRLPGAPSLAAATTPATTNLCSGERPSPIAPTFAPKLFLAALFSLTGLPRGRHLRPARGPGEMHLQRHDARRVSSDRGTPLTEPAPGANDLGPARGEPVRRPLELGGRACAPA